MRRIVSVVVLLGSLLLMCFSVQAATKAVGFDFGRGTHKAYFSVKTKRPPAFHVVLRIRNNGTRAILSYRKSTWRKRQALMDTRSYGCEGAAGSLYCEARYENFPEGTYVFFLRKVGRRSTHVDVSLDC
ncbi:hypothetical protein [Crenothrix sp.]|uniref:hypothetical protein n=1 Tax=Crenothrix sp. TaxID=3100433 RepID=UPI00374D06BD